MTCASITPAPNPETLPPQVRPRSIHLILDFDGTITTEDTTALLVEIAREILTPPGEERLRHLKLWESCQAEYASALEKHALAVRSSPPGEGRNAIDEEVDYQRGLRGIEEESVLRCGGSGLFKGVSAEAWRLAGHRVCQNRTLGMRPEFQMMVQRLESRAGGTCRWGVVSVNWSRDFVKGVLDIALGGEMKSECVPVLSNQIEGETGYIVGPKFGPAPCTDAAMKTQPVRRSQVNVEAWNYRQLQILNSRKLILTSDDKLEAMKSLRDSFKGSIPDQNRECLPKEDPFETPSKIEPLVVYVGDSLTDLECLIEADVGIVMSPRGIEPFGSLMQAFLGNNISVPHISCFDLRKGNSIWWAMDFLDIVSCGLFDDSVSPVRKQSQLKR